MAMNGFLNSEITSSNKRRWPGDERPSADAVWIGHFLGFHQGHALRHLARECMSDTTAKTNEALSHKTLLGLKSLAKKNNSY